MLGTDQKPQTAALRSNGSIQTAFDYAQRAVGLVAYVAVLGFVVSYFILSKQTATLSYAVYPQQYLVWGALLLVFGTIYRIVPIAVGAFLLTFVLSVVTNKITVHKWKIISSLQNTIHATRLIYSHPLVLLLLFALLFTSAFKPESVFPASNPSPSSTITIIFKEDIDPDLWLLPTKTGQQKSTRSLHLLAQYTDGLLVKDVATGTIVEIKNDMIAGIIHNSQTLLPGTVLPSNTASPTAATLTPTP